MTTTPPQKKKNCWTIPGIDLVSKRVAIYFTNKLNAESLILALTEFIHKLNFPNGNFSLLSDWGADFRSGRFQTFLEQRSIRHLLSNPLSKNKSSLNERVHRLLTRARLILAH